MKLRIWRCGCAIGMAVLGALPLPAIAHAQTAPSIAAPIRIDVDYSPDRTPATNHEAYAIGPQSDYLPEAVPKATQIVLRLSERRVYVYDEDQVLDSYSVAIGAPSTPTPTGEFKIFQTIVNPVWQSPWTGEVFAPGPTSALGLRWIGFVELPNGIIGFHGTPTVSSIGQATSNGCVRLRNEDVLELFEHVRIGMTVIVEP